MTIQTDLIRLLEEYRDKIHGGNAERAANALGVTPPTLSRWLNGVHIPRVETLIPVFDKLQARIVLPGENTSIDGLDFVKYNEKMEALEKENHSLRENVKALTAKIEYSLELEAARAGALASAQPSTPRIRDADFIEGKTA